MPDWQSVNACLPVGSSEQDKQRRKELWHDLQVINPQYLALFELDAGMEKVLQCGEFIDAKAAIRRAHRYAREVNPNGPKDKLEFCEFRLLLVYLKGFLAIYQVFTSLDESRDQVLSLEELQNAGARLDALGIQVRDPAALWGQLRGSNEVVDFGEFSDWAIRQGLAGPELLERSQLEDAKLAGELKAVLGTWSCCSDGAVQMSDLRRLLRKLDPSVTDKDLAILLSSGAPGTESTIREGKVTINDFINDVLKK